MIESLLFLGAVFMWFVVCWVLHCMLNPPTTYGQICDEERKRNKDTIERWKE